MILSCRSPYFLLLILVNCVVEVVISTRGLVMACSARMSILLSFLHQSAFLRLHQEGELLKVCVLASELSFKNTIHMLSHIRLTWKLVRHGWIVWLHRRLTCPFLAEPSCYRPLLKSPCLPAQSSFWACRSSTTCGFIWTLKKPLVSPGSRLILNHIGGLILGHLSFTPLKWTKGHLLILIKLTAPSISI